MKTRLISTCLAALLVGATATAQNRTETAKLGEPTPIQRNNFGDAAAISGDIMVVGTGSGSALYVFEKTATGWDTSAPIATLTASAAAAQLNGGVAIDGDTIVASDQLGEIVYVFVKPANGWTTTTETATLRPSDRSGLGFGSALAVKGDTIVVGRSLDDDNGQYSGSAYVFVKPQSGWTSTTETAKLTASDGDRSDQFGLSVSIDNDTVVIGAPSADNNVSVSGAIYVFTKPTTGWVTSTELCKLAASDGARGDRLGSAVAIHGDTVAAGAQGHGAGGAAYVFEKPSAGWAATTETAKLTPSDGAAGHDFGDALALYGDEIVVGAKQSFERTGPGWVYLFSKPTTGWATMTETETLQASDQQIDDQFGGAVAIDRDVIVVGARSDSNAQRSRHGSVYVFQTTQLTGSGSTHIGTARTLTLDAYTSRSALYLAATSFGDTPLALEDRRMGITPDVLWTLSVTGALPATFVNYSGNLDATGQATATLNIADVAATVGLTLHSAFITVEAGAIYGISNTTSFQITAP